MTSRARAYYYWHPGRGTKSAGERTRLPDDPQSPEFWDELRRLQRTAFGPRVLTVGEVIDQYQSSPEFDALSPRTQKHYRFYLKLARSAWDASPADSLRPRHVLELVQSEADRPASANAILGVMRALSAWGTGPREKFPHSIVQGVKAPEMTGGHKPWTAAQLAAIPELPEMVRRVVFLERFTGQRGSDVVRLGPTDLKEGGFSIVQQKTGREVWVPVLPELAAEMATWERRPGPFILSPTGKPYTRHRVDVLFAEAKASIPALAETTMHGLRATAVIDFRRAGLTPLQIQDIVGMSLPTIQRYCRFADRVASGKAALFILNRERLKNA